jgi:hypothetical protein
MLLAGGMSNKTGINFDDYLKRMREFNHLHQSL